jgi:hypothetical protein
MTAQWRPCSFTPIHSLTGPVSQSFASHVGGGGAKVPVLGMHPGLQWNRVLLLAMPRYIGDLNVIRSLASPLFSGRFTRLRETM